MPDLPTRLARKYCHYHDGLNDDPESCLCGVFAEIAREALEEAEKITAEETYYKCKCAYMEGEGYRGSSHIAECLIRNEMHDILAAALWARREGHA